MKRSDELAPLSRDHHVALEHALRLRRAGTGDVHTIVARFLAFFVAGGERHFAQEEELLPPALGPDDGELDRRLHAEHAEIRERARALGAQPRPDEARALGELLTAHVRWEERELFPRIEERLAPGELAALGRRLAPGGPGPRR